MFAGSGKFYFCIVGVSWLHLCVFCQFQDMVFYKSEELSEIRSLKSM